MFCRIALMDCHWWHDHPPGSFSYQQKSDMSIKCKHKDNHSYIIHIFKGGTYDHHLHFFHSEMQYDIHSLGW